MVQNHASSALWKGSARRCAVVSRRGLAAVRLAMAPMAIVSF
jgi:hypothetical protein